MATHQNIPAPGDSWFQGEDKELTLTVAGLTAADVAEAIWVLCLQQGGAAMVTKTIGDGITVSPASDPAELVIMVDGTDSQTLTGGYYHECRVTDGTGAEDVVCYGNAVIKASSTVSEPAP